MLSHDIIKQLAELSKIEFTDVELDKITADMTDIIKLMDKVRDFNTNTHTHISDTVDYKNLRADNFKPSSPSEEIIKNAKKVTGNSFTVPKVV